MPELSILLPTVPGSVHLDETIGRYRETLGGVDYEICVLDGYPAWGIAVIAGLAQTSGRYVLAGADDAPPHPGWWPAALTLLEDKRGGIVTPFLVNSDGTPYAWFSEVADGDEVRFGHFPLASRDTWERLRPLPTFHHYADCYLAERAKRLGIPVRCTTGWKASHYRTSDDLPGDGEQYRLWQELFLDRQP